MSSLARRLLMTGRPKKSLEVGEVEFSIPEMALDETQAFQPTLVDLRHSIISLNTYGMQPSDMAQDIDLLLPKSWFSTVTSSEMHGKLSIHVLIQKRFLAQA